MAEPNVYPVFDGQSIFIPDLQHLGTVAGLADDRVLAEILRITPYDGSNVFRGVLPYGYKGELGAAYPGGTVQSTGFTNGSVAVSPFRLVIGSRNQASAAPPGTNPAVDYQPNSLANWRDIRSGIWVATSSALATNFPLAANSSGNPRWDLVYAALTVDANGPGRTVRVKDPATGAVSALSAPYWLYSPVAVNVVTGTPGASPTLPAIPGDSGGVYYAPLAYVYVPNGFSSSSTVLSKNIRAYANGTANYMLPSHGYVEPASGSNDRTGTYATNMGWLTTTAGARPSTFLPPDMVGGKQVIVEVDSTNGGSWSHPNGSIVDNSIDWRNRFIVCHWAFNTNTAGSSLASDPNGVGSGGIRVPLQKGSTGVGPLNQGTAFSSTFGTANDNLVTGSPDVVYLDNSFGLSGGAVAGLYVDASSGALKFHGAGATNIAYFAFWIMASAALPNF